MADAFSALKSREEAVIMRTYGRYPLAVSRAQGSRLFDLEGRQYVDLLAGIAVCNLGHCHPEVAEVVCRQARELVHVSNLFYQAEQVELAERLLSTCHCGKAFFCNSGPRPTKGPSRLARRFMREGAAGRPFEIITLAGSFHGRTLATLTATGQDKIKHGFAPLPEGFVTVPFGDLDAVRPAITDKTAGVLIEIVQGEGGVNPMPGRLRARPGVPVPGKGPCCSWWTDPDRHVPHGQVLGLPASRRRAGHLHLRQGPGQRPAHGRAFGHRRGGRRFVPG